MNKVRTIYNQVGVFAGSSPASGFHFLDLNGNPSNNDYTGSNFNLIFPIQRVQQASYSFDIPRTDIKAIGYYGTIARPNLINPNVSLSFNYLQQGLINEARLGLLFNHPSGLSNTPLYGQQGNIPPISGLIDRNNDRSNENRLGWPRSNRDGRNIFIATRQDNLDLNDFRFNYNYKSSNVDVFAFGDCYLNSYKTSAAVGQFPACSVDFTCGNIEFYNYASGKTIPSVNPRTAQKYDSITYNLPNTFQGSGMPTVLLPSNIIVSIHDIPTGDLLAAYTSGTNELFLVLDAYGDAIALTLDSDPNNLPNYIPDAKIQGYTIDLDLNRQPLYNLGYKYPMDRPIAFPIFANLNISFLWSDNATGSLLKLIEKDREYDVDIKLNYSRNSYFTGTAVLYRFRGAKFNGMSINDQIGSNRSANMSFTSEIKLDDTYQGFFISGQLGILPTQQLSGIYAPLF